MPSEGGCLASGSNKVFEKFQEVLSQKGLADSVKLVGCGCLGPCVRGPIVVMKKDNIFYQKSISRRCRRNHRHSYY